MATDYALGGSRVGLDGVSSIAWQSACDTVVTGWDVSDQAIIAVNHFTQSHTPLGESMKLRWRNATDSGSFGHDSYGLMWAEGSKNLGSDINTSVGTTSVARDTFDGSATLNTWSSWYGNTVNDLVFGTVNNKMAVGATDAISYAGDIEATGSDYHMDSWYATSSIDNYDEMFCVSVLGSGSSSDLVKDVFSVYDNPAVVTTVNNIFSSGFDDKSFVYVLSKNATDILSEFNVTGDVSWGQSTEKLYFVITNTTNDNNLYVDEGGSWNLVLSNSSVQYEVNGSYFDALFFIDVNASETNSYFFGAAEQLNDPASVPTGISCDGSTCNDTFEGIVEVNCSGSVDPDELEMLRRA